MCFICKQAHLQWKHSCFICSYYHCLRRSLKWTRKFGFHLFNLAVVNAYILWKKTQINEGKKIDKDSHYHFRYQLAEQLLEMATTAGVCTPRSRANVKDSPARLRESGTHFPQFHPPTQSRSKATRRCHVCTKSGLSKNTSVRCPECNVSLCVAPCFELYHTMQCYRRKEPTNSAVEQFCGAGRRRGKNSRKQAKAEASPSKPKRPAPKGAKTAKRPRTQAVSKAKRSLVASKP